MAVQQAAAKKARKAGKAKKAGTARAKPAQDRFLTELVATHAKVAIFLVNGLKLEGKVASYDDYGILLEGESSDHVYKHAISTIQPLAGAVAPKRAVARSAPARVAPQYAAPEAERKARPAPTIVVRAKRRVIKKPE